MPSLRQQLVLAACLHQVLSPGQTIATRQDLSTQHIATLLGATCCVRLATVLRCVVTCWVLFGEV